MKTLEAELEAVVQGDTARASPKENAPVDEDVGRDLGRNFGSSGGKHVRLMSKKFGEEQDERVTPGYGRQQAKIVDADRTACLGREGHHDDDPYDSNLTYSRA